MSSLETVLIIVVVLLAVVVTAGLMTAFTVIRRLAASADGAAKAASATPADPGMRKPTSDPRSSRHIPGPRRPIAESRHDAITGSAASATVDESGGSDDGLADPANGRRSGAARPRGRAPRRSGGKKSIPGLRMRTPAPTRASTPRATAVQRASAVAETTGRGGTAVGDDRGEIAAARAEAARILEQARVDADGVRERTHERVAEERRRALDAAREQAEREATSLAQAIESQRVEAEHRQRRLDERDQRVADESARLADESVRLAQRDRRLSAAEAELAERVTRLEGREARLVVAADEQRRELERIAGLTADVAKAELINAIEVQAKRDAVLLVRGIESDARATGEARARRVVVEAIQRVASEQTAESVVSVMHLPSDEMKGRIIGREGRNIRAFESVTGVNLIIDDTPEAVLLSCFDPVRREVGRLTLEKLVLDGRIHPHRIEEIFETARTEVDRLCLRAAEDALHDVGITDIHPDLITLLGRLRYRTSYGQNVLKHLVESAHLAGVMAAELGIDVALIKRCAFLHDIGKALTHEVEGSHALIGADVARRCGEIDEVVHAIEAHHNEVQPQTIEALLTQASDACSGGRPGARRESLELYVKRLERIEEIASTKPGVEKVFAMQAGREIRVMVRPDDVDDLGAAVLAKDVAKQIEDELTYPGQIRVTVVRESRASELAR